MTLFIEGTYVIVEGCPLHDVKDTGNENPAVTAKVLA